MNDESNSVDKTTTQLFEQLGEDPKRPVDRTEWGYWLSVGEEVNNPTGSPQRHHTIMADIVDQLRERGLLDEQIVEVGREVRQQLPIAYEYDLPLEFQFGVLLKTLRKNVKGDSESTMWSGECSWSLPGTGTRRWEHSKERALLQASGASLQSQDQAVPDDYVELEISKEYFAISLTARHHIQGLSRASRTIYRIDNLGATTYWINEPTQFVGRTVPVLSRAAGLVTGFVSQRTFASWYKRQTELNDGTCPEILANCVAVEGAMTLIASYGSVLEPSIRGYVNNYSDSFKRRMSEIGINEKR